MKLGIIGIRIDYFKDSIVYRIKLTVIFLVLIRNNFWKKKSVIQTSGSLKDPFWDHYYSKHGDICHRDLKGKILQGISAPLSTYRVDGEDFGLLGGRMRDLYGNHAGPAAPLLAHGFGAAQVHCVPQVTVEGRICLDGRN